MKHMNSSSCSAAKVICRSITLALYLCFSVVSTSLYFFGNIPRLLHITMQTCKRNRTRLALHHLPLCLRHVFGMLNRSQGLGEIAFCAITSNEQVKGFGARLMNYTKVCLTVGCMGVRHRSHTHTHTYTHTYTHT